MPAKTPAERIAAYRARQRKAGIVSVTVEIPEQHKAELQALAKRWRAKHSKGVSDD